MMNLSSVALKPLSAPHTLTPPASYTNFRLASSAMSANTAVSVNVPTVTDTDVNAKAKVLVYDVCFYTDDVERIDDTMILHRWQSGFQCVVRIFDMKADMKLNVYAVNLAATVHMCTTVAKFTHEGLPEESGALANVPSDDFLTKDDGITVFDTYVGSLVSYMAEHADKLTKEHSQYTVSSTAKTVSDRAKSIAFAMRQIANGNTLHEAQALMLEHGLDLDVDVIGAIYAGELGTPSDGTPPSDAQRKKAKAWLDV